MHQHLRGLSRKAFKIMMVALLAGGLVSGCIYLRSLNRLVHKTWKADDGRIIEIVSSSWLDQGTPIWLETQGNSFGNDRSGAIGTITSLDEDVMMECRFATLEDGRKCAVIVHIDPPRTAEAFVVYRGSRIDTLYPGLPSDESNSLDTVRKTYRELKQILPGTVIRALEEEPRLPSGIVPKWRPGMD